jgi:amino acid transporter
MASSFPRVGGLVAYLRLSFGRPVAFLSGWSILLITWPGSIASVALAAGELVSADADAGTSAAAGPTGGARAIAAAIIVGLGLVNLLGIRFGARFEIGVTAVKFLFLGGMLVTAAVATALRAAAPEATAAAEGAAASLPAMPHNALGLAAVLGSAMVSIIFTYDGYADAVYMAGETRDPARSLPRALAASLLLITILYILANVSFIVGLGVPAMAQSKFVGRDLARAAFAGAGIAAFAAVGLIVMAGAVNSYLLTGPRIARLLAEEGLAAPAFGVVGGRGVPVVATLWLVAVSLVLLFTNSFEELLELTVPVIWLTNLAVAAGLLVQRRRAPERPRPFRVPAAGWLVGAQILIGVGCLASVVAYFASSGKLHILGIDAAAIAVGLGLYRLLTLRERKLREASR